MSSPSVTNPLPSGFPSATYLPPPHSVPVFLLGIGQLGTLLAPSCSLCLAHFDPSLVCMVPPPSLQVFTPVSPPTLSTCHIQFPLLSLLFLLQHLTTNLSSSLACLVCHGFLTRMETSPNLDFCLVHGLLARPCLIQLGSGLKFQDIS
jgi:hypothetical protein